MTERILDGMDLEDVMDILDSGQKRYEILDRKDYGQKGIWNEGYLEVGVSAEEGIPGRRGSGMKGFCTHEILDKRDIRFWTEKITGSRGSRKYVVWEYEYLEGGVGQRGISREGVEILDRRDMKSGQKRSWVEDLERRVLGSRGIQKEEYLDRKGSRQQRFWIERFLDNTTGRTIRPIE